MKGKGCFYSVGVGPGDEALLTVKAVELLKNCDVICVPYSDSDNILALQIVEKYIDGKKIKKIFMPMVRDEVLLEECHARATQEIAKLLDEGLSCAFLTLGDPSIYSTAMYVHKRLVALGYLTEVIPGVPSFCAAAARLQISLCEGESPLFILPTATANHREWLERRGTKVFMKSGKTTVALKESLQRHASADAVYFVERATLPDEKVGVGVENMDAPSSYFTLTIVKERG